jgi:alpha-L-fucosidase
MVQQWFRDAKLGIFIHWGIYSVEGVEESWAFFRGDMSYERYMAQLEGFSAAQYRPAEWVEHIRKSGANYTVISSKHHDGVALWDTAHSNLSIPSRTPAGKDVLTPFCKAAREHDLALGIYFSLIDWNHPDYASVNHALWGRRYNQGLGPDASGDRFGFAYPSNGIEKPEKWNRYLDFLHRQLGELQSRYNPDLFWFDGDWERTEEQWQAKQIIDRIRNYNKNVMFNSRLCGHGDYATPEQVLPVTAPDTAWEACMTMSDSWGYRKEERNYKSLERIIHSFVDIVSMGGNLLLAIGPRADGSIPEEEIDLLSGLGAWNRTYGQALFGTSQGLPFGHVHAPTTLSWDKKNLYVFTSPQDGLNENREILLKGIKSSVKRVTSLGPEGTEKSLSFSRVGGASWYDIPGLLWVNISSITPDPVMNVIKLEFDAPIELYRGAAGQFSIKERRE